MGSKVVSLNLGRVAKNDPVDTLLCRRVQKFGNGGWTGEGEEEVDARPLVLRHLAHL